MVLSLAEEDRKYTGEDDPYAAVKVHQEAIMQRLLELIQRRSSTDIVALSDPL